MQPLPALLLIVLFASTSLSMCRPSGEAKSELTAEPHSSSSSGNVVSSDGYQVSVTESEVDGKCRATLTLRGPGIDKHEEYPCPERPEVVITLGGALLVSGRYFSDTPGELIHIGGDNCEKEVFTEKDGTYTSELKPMDKGECEKVMAKVEMLTKQHKEWNDWMIGYQQQTQQQLLQAQQDLQALQQQIFGGLFGWRAKK